MGFGEITWQQRGFNSAIDFVICNEAMYGTFDRMEIDENQEKIQLSDHNLITVWMKFDRKSRKFDQNKEITFLRINKTNTNKFIDNLNEHIDNEYENLTIENFEKILINQIEKVFQKKKKIRVSSDYDEP